MASLKALRSCFNVCCVSSASSTLLKNERIKVTFWHALKRSSSYSAHVSYPYSYSYGRSDKTLTYSSIGAMLAQNAKTGKNQATVMSYEENIEKTLAEFDDDVNRVANGMYNLLGVKHGDVVGIWSCNNYSWMVIQHACYKIGAIVCTVNPVYKVPELDYLLRKGQVKTIFLPGIGSQQEQVNNYVQLLQETLKNRDTPDKNGDKILVEDVVFIDGDKVAEAGVFKNCKVYYYNNLIRTGGSFDESLTENVSPDDPAMIMFTSGTTGKPKGALQSHFTLLNNVVLTSHRTGFDEMSGVKICNPLPLFHTFASVLGSVSMSCVPFSIALTGFRYNIKSIVETINKYSCSHLMATPTIVIDMLNYVEKNKIECPSLCGALIGGSPVPVELAYRITRTIPSCKDVRVGYGATEFGPCSTANFPTNTLEQKIQTVGSPLDFVEIKIVDPQTGKIRKIGEEGELCARGHTVMMGYWRDEEKTRESFDKRNWFKSGDLAVMDEKGFIKIVGRTKEMIIRGGENIYPREIEEVLHQHPDILDAYVTGVPDERTGEEVCAWVKLRDPQKKMTEEEVKDFLKAKISYFKVPRYVLFVDGFPLTPTGKAIKYIMRKKSCELLGLKESKDIKLDR